MKPLVTVAIPTLNGADYLRETLSSLLAQDYSNLDILVSDNASSDDSLALATSLAQGDPRVRFRRNETTVPIHEHYNQCLDAARGEFYCMLDDDDLISPNFVSSLVDLATRHPQIDIVVPRNVTIDSSGVLTKEYSVPEGEVVDGFQLVCDWLYQRTLPRFACVGTFLLRTATIRRLGGYQAFELGLHIDNLLFLQCSVGKQVGFSTEAVFKFRVYATSYASKPRFRQLAKSTQSLLRVLQRHPQTVAVLSTLSLAQRKEILEGVRFMCAYDMLARIKFFESPASIEKFRKLMELPIDSTLYRFLLKYYFRRIRDLVTPRGSSTRVDLG